MSNEEFMDLVRISKDIKELVILATAREREACAQIAETAGLGEPHSLPPYSVRKLIAREIRNRG
jgi:site-specific recombinase XerC